MSPVLSELKPLFICSDCGFMSFDSLESHHHDRQCSGRGARPYLMSELKPSPDSVRVKQKPLRICIDCKSKAYTFEELEQFKKHKHYLFDRLNLCKPCSNKRNLKYKKARRANQI